MPHTLKPLKHFLRLVPDKIHTHLLTRLGSRIMLGQPITSRLDFMEGKRIKITIKDTGNCWRFIIRNNVLLEDISYSKKSDVHIQGELKTFLLLATGNEDPDSLFFSRKLSLEGNTEDGLYIKNLMDAMDFDMEVFLKSILGVALAHRIAPLVDSFEVGKRIHEISKRILVG